MKFRDYTKYEVYEDGRIYSYKSKKFLKPQTNNSGYKQVFLSDNNCKRKMYLLHRVVYEAVTGEPIPECMQINHIDEKKDNNMISNLELVSPKQNINYGTGIQRRAKSVSKSMTNNPKHSKQVGAFKNGELVMTFPSTMEAQRQGYNSGSVAACCRKCYKREGNNVFKGYEWRYI